MDWKLTFSLDLLEKKKNQLQKKSSQNLKIQAQSKLRDDQMAFEDENEGKVQFTNNDHSQEKQQEKDKFKNLTLAELLKLQSLRDYDRQIKNIVQMVHLHPIKLNIPQDLKKYLYQQVLQEINQPAKEINIKISPNYKTIAYKDCIFLASKILLKLEPASNFHDNRFDTYVYCETGEMIFSFHNFDSMEKLFKQLREKFRRIETIYFLHLVESQNVSLQQYLEARIILQLKNPKINFIGIFCKQKHNFKETKSNFIDFKPQSNVKVVAQQEIHQFCILNSIKLIQDHQIVSCENSNQSQFLRFTRAVLRKRKFDDFYLKFVNYGDEKIIQYRKRNQLSLKLMNYCFEKCFTLQTQDQVFSPQKIKQFFTQLVYQILEQKQKAQAKQIQKMIQQPKNHQIEQFDISAKQCIKCKRKTKFRCKKCSLRYEFQAMVCKDCFEDFHSKEYFKKEALQILTHKTRNQRHPWKNCSGKHEKIDKRSYKNKLRQKAKKNELQKFPHDQHIQNQEERHQSSKQKDQEIIDPFKEYRKMKSFIFSCQHSIMFS